MKSKLALCSMVLGCSMGLMAQQNSNAPGSTPPTFPQDQSQQQTSQPSSSPTAAPDATQQSSQTGQTDTSKSGEKQKVEGCLSGSDGNFTLTDKSGMTYSLQGENSELAKHVNQEIRVEGMASAASGSSAASTSSGASGGSTLTVSKVKKVSDTCASSPSSTGGAAPKTPY